MNTLTYVKLEPQNKKHCIEFANLMRLYAKELDCHNNRQTTDTVITEWIDSIIKIQGDYDRHLNLCFDDETLIGFLYGKIDRPEHKGYKKIGYGYIMEFFVLPEYRRKSYGREMFYHLQKLFANNGASRMYLTADGVTGKPFWQSMGFMATGEICPENNQEIYEKSIFNINNIEIKILRYPDNEVLKAITKRHGEKSQDIEICISDTIINARYNSDFFCTVATYNNDIIGWANFFESSLENGQWLYSDLWVDTYYRRQGIAKKIIKSGLEYLSQFDARILKCTVEPNNSASINLQKSIGFKETILTPFEDFDIKGQIMFEINIEQNYNIVELTDRYDYLLFICDLLKKANNITDNEYQRLYKETRDTLILNNDSRKNNYIIRKGIVPIAWARVDKSNHKDDLFKTHLIIHTKYKNIGIEEKIYKYLEQCKFGK